jgi:hypothetical protein
MADRKHYLVQLIDEARVEIEATTKYAMNSGIRAGEVLLGDLGRRQGTQYQGSAPTREGAVYTRAWTPVVPELGRPVTVKVSRTR